MELLLNQVNKMAKPLTCKYCGRKFHKGKSNAFGRMSNHIWKDHKVAHSKAIKKGQRKKKSQLEQEFEFTDDMIIQSLIDAGIPLQLPRQNQQIGSAQDPEPQPPKIRLHNLPISIHR